MQEVFTLEEARALQGKYLVATHSLMEKQNFPPPYDEYCLVPENHAVHVIGFDAGYQTEGVAVACIAVQYYGPMIGNNRVLPKVILMDNVNEAAEVLRVSKDWIYRRQCWKSLPFAVVLSERKILFSLKGILKYIEEKQHGRQSVSAE